MATPSPTLLVESTGRVPNRPMTNCLGDYYRLPSEWSDCLSPEPVGGKQGFFQFGPDVICYGRCKTGNVSSTIDADLHDALNDVSLAGRNAHLPFDPADLVENLRRERYENDLLPRWEQLIGRKMPQKFYYFMRDLLPFPLRRTLQRAYFSGWENIRFPAWPVDFTVDTLHEELLKLAMKARGVQRVPFIWFWPNSAPSCLIMTHDVEDSGGRDLTNELMDLDEAYGFRASFQVIPEKRYEVTETYVHEIRNRGFEFNVHDLNHDGHLYHERQEFLRRAKLINEYARRFGSHGFRAGSMYRNADWYEAFEFSYDMSVPNVAHLEPKRGGCCTVMPFFIGSVLELPLTTTQDYSLLHILNDYSIDLWKTQLALIRQRNGLMSFITHADYLADAREQSVYRSLLAYLREMVAREGIWAPLPGEVDTWWRARNEMKLVSCKSGWTVEGPESERARVAYAVLTAGQLVYEL
ncbi:MAG TPA: hypothetical protein VN682_09715 [Terriglobales bacterium]|nr:hypothetical protein [Terriglobales bacterium]